LKEQKLPKPKQPSAHDVAHLAGVSQAAVSRAFTPGASISDATRTKVLQAAEKLGYRPNLLARSLITGKSGIIGVVVGNATDQLTSFALDYLSTHLAYQDKHILLFTAEETANADVQVENLLKFRVDALLMMASTLSPRLAERCEKEKIPVLFLNGHYGRHRKFSSITGENAKGAKILADHLVNQGYKKIAVITGHKNSKTAYEREVAFSKQLARRGQRNPLLESGLCLYDEAIVATRKLLSRKQRPDALFCVNDLMALAAIEVAKYEFGLTIGRDIGIAGFDNIKEASWQSFDLTTFSFPVLEVVEEVVSILVAGPDPEKPIHKSIMGELKIRGSTNR